MVHKKTAGFLYIAFSALNIFISLLCKTNFLTYVLFVYLLGAYLVKKIRKEAFLIYTLFLPNKYLQLLALPVFLFMEGKLLNNKLGKRKTVFMIYISTLSILNCVIYNGFLFSSLFQIALYYCVIRFLEIMQEGFDKEIVYQLFNQMFWLECIAVLLQLIILQTTMDALTGTLISAHYLGVFLVIYVYTLLNGGLEYITLPQKIVRTVIGITMLILADAKHIWALFLLALFVMSILKHFKIKNKITLSVLLMTIGIAIALILANTQIVKTLITDKFLYTYIYNTNYNKKFEFFLNTLKQMKSWNGLFGFGVGQYGSQICLTMSKGIIYMWNPLLAKYHFAIQPYVDAISGIMSEWYVKNGIVLSSLVLGYPLVSFAGFVGELGLVGLYMFLRILDINFKKGNHLFIIFFFMISIFDTYFEIPCVFIMLLLAANMGKQKMNKSIVTEACYDT